MSRTSRVAWLAVCCAWVGGAGTSPAETKQYRRISMDDYVDKMKGGWLGQMVGVGWGGPTEFNFNSVIMPADEMPAWKPDTVNQFFQDDIYVEMTFLRTLEEYGWDVSIRQAGLDFANSGYDLWHANRAGRTNLRNGIAPPDSSHPKFNHHADDIDYQIEADYSGLIAPGMPNTVIGLGEIFGRIMNYGDGLYGGQFVGGMVAEAFFEDDMEKIIEAGLKCIPSESQYTEAIRDVIAWWKQNPDDWEKTWRLINVKYQENPDYRRSSCESKRADFNIDAKINGAYIVMGLLYGQSDPDDTIIISTRCGQDSDCNPSNAGGILFTILGYEKAPERFKSALDPSRKFSHTAYDFPGLIEVCEKLAREAVTRAGGKIEKDADGNEVLVIPMEEPRPSDFAQCWAPGPIADSRFTEKEMATIDVTDIDDPVNAIRAFAPEWKIVDCGDQFIPAYRKDYNGKKGVLVTHPLTPEVGCVIRRTVKIGGGGKAKLRLVVGHHPLGDWTLIVRANGTEILNRSIGKETAPDGWAEIEVDLSDYAGLETRLELVNQPSGWAYEVAHWAAIDLSDE